MVEVVVVVGGGYAQQKLEGDGEGREGGARVFGREGGLKETEIETNWKNNRGTNALLLFQLR